MVELGSIGRLLLYGSLAVSPLAILIFRPRVMGGGLFGNMWRMLQDYWIHFSLFLVIYWQKNYVDDLNDPIRGVFGDFTWVIHAIEGNAVVWVQGLFEHPWLTAILNFNYLFAYIFLNYFSVILATYADDRELANKLALNYFVIYLLSVPFYIFFNVQVTSDIIPGMRSLLYHGSENYLNFFVAADPLDNAWPSLHIGIPYGLFLLMWWTMKDRGHTLDTWGYGLFLKVIIVEIVVFAFSILYLGIHWITDIPGGLLMGLLGAAIVEEIHESFFKTLYGWAGSVKQGARRLGGWVQGRSAPEIRDGAPGTGGRDAPPGDKPQKDDEPRMKSTPERT